MALFGGSSDGRREPRSLVEFRGGKMKLNGRTVTADTRKGLVYMKISDSLLHFCWKDRQTGEVADDFIIFPGDAEFMKVPQCTTGRVFLLKFKDSSSRKFFYWMQEPSEEKDEEIFKKVNDLLQHPPDLTSQAGEGMAGGGLMPGLPPGYMAIPGSQVQNLLGEGGGGGRISQQQLMELLSGGTFPHSLLARQGMGGYEGQRGDNTASSPSQAAPPTTTSTSTPPTSSSSAANPPHAPARPQQSQQQQLDQLQNILSSLHVPNLQQPQAPPEDPVSLNEVLSSDVIRPLSNDEEAVTQMTPHLPPTGQSVEDVLSSPQFQQAVSVFGSGLQSGQLGPLMGQFGLGQGVSQSATSGDLRAFAEALQNEIRGVASGTDQSDEKQQQQTQEKKEEGKEEKEEGKEKGEDGGRKEEGDKKGDKAVQEGPREEGDGGN